MELKKPIVTSYTVTFRSTSQDDGCKLSAIIIILANIEDFRNEICHYTRLERINTDFGSSTFSSMRSSQFSTAVLNCELA
jgi:hypothetical protein